jgi:putative ABC transport system permease protein
MASRNLRRRKGRTILTVSGIVVGVALIMVLLSLTAGTSTRTSGLIRDILPAQITVVNSTIPTGGGAGLRALFSTAYPLNQSTTSAISGLSGVYAVTGQLSATGYVDGDAVLLSGIDPSTYSNVTGGLNILSGTSITSASGNQVVLGETLASRLGVSAGSSVTVGANATGGATYTVVGIYSSGNTFLDRSIYVSLTNAQAIVGDQGKLTEIYVKADTSSNVTQIASEIGSKVPGVKVVTSSNLATVASTLSGTLTTFFTVIGLVALLAGGFGVVNTMMISVSERTREIGTLKALGARQGQIMKIFISEAFLIGVIGAAAGILIGAIVSFALPSFTGAASASGLGGAGVGGLFRGALAPSITPGLVVLSLALGISVGVLAGLYPAWHASKMDPVEALRHV